MNILCLDYGTRRIGVALATTPLAEPLEIISNATKTGSDVATSQALDAILRLVDQHAIGLIVVGISEEAMSQKTRQFIELLTQFTSVRIEEMDETLSSYQTYAQMKTMKKSKREGNRDHFAAANILQNYLDTHEEKMID